MRNLPTFVGVADFSSALFARLRTDRACEFYQGYDDAKTQEKGFKYKVSIVKQLKNSSVAITAERYGL